MEPASRTARGERLAPSRPSTRLAHTWYSTLQTSQTHLVLWSITRLVGSGGEKNSECAPRGSFYTSPPCGMPPTRKDHRALIRSTNTNTKSSTTTRGLILRTEKTCGYGAYPLLSVSHLITNEPSRVTSRRPSKATSISVEVLLSARLFRWRLNPVYTLKGSA